VRFSQTASDKDRNEPLHNIVIPKIFKGFFSMATKKINMPPKEVVIEEAPVRKGQLRPTQERYLLQVDRQTKRSFAVAEEAQKAGEAVKKAYPMVMVSIYDTAESVSTPIT
jgi:hypothetical protein